MKPILNIVALLVILFTQDTIVRGQQAETTSSVDTSKKAGAETTHKPKSQFPEVPTTKILAIGRFTTPPTPEQIKEFFPREVPDTLRLYLAGKIDQWWVRQDQTGPVFLMNVTSVAEARALLEKLPLGQAKLMEFEYIELGPLTPLNLLLSEGWAKGGK
jgi:hypothetical protein